jgi:enoyl-CoA hydratase
MTNRTEFETVIYEPVADHVVRVTMNRPDKRNAQNHKMTYDINRAFDLAAADDDVKVIILAGAGPHFNAGHDQINRGEAEDIETVGTWFGYDLPGMEGLVARNKETYFDICWRWRNIPKVIIGQAHGKSIGGGLMLLWICDIIIASDDALFADPVVNIGCNGVEYFAHPWEMGPRKAKEFLFTGDFYTADQMERTGMINQVVPRDQLEERTLQMAKRIAEKPSWGLKLAKEAVNGMLDTQGQFPAMRAAYSLCSLGHAQMMVTGDMARKRATPDAERLFTNRMETNAGAGPADR